MTKTLEMIEVSKLLKKYNIDEEMRILLPKSRIWVFTTNTVDCIVCGEKLEGSFARISTWSNDYRLHCDKAKCKKGVKSPIDITSNHLDGGQERKYQRYFVFVVKQKEAIKE